MEKEDKLDSMMADLLGFENEYDILNQNQSINRTVTDFYVEDSKNDVLQRYFMISFIYKIRSYKTQS